MRKEGNLNPRNTVNLSVPKDLYSHCSTSGYVAACPEAAAHPKESSSVRSAGIPHQQHCICAVYSSAWCRHQWKETWNSRLAQNTNCQAKSSKSSKRELCERSTGATACLPSETTGLGAVLLGLALPQFCRDHACVGTAFPSPNCLLSTIIAIFEIFLLAYLWGFS